MQNILEESMGEVIEFPVELTRPPAGIAYDLYIKLWKTGIMKSIKSLKMILKY